LEHEDAAFTSFWNQPVTGRPIEAVLEQTMADRRTKEGTIKRRRVALSVHLPYMSWPPNTGPKHERKHLMLHQVLSIGAWGISVGRRIDLQPDLLTGLLFLSLKMTA
jgi:hypothetical protein